MKEIYESANGYVAEGRVEYSSKALQLDKAILAVLERLHSSKELSITRTSPVVNRLIQVWVSAVSGSEFVDINRVHRSRYLDITSSDPVEDYLQFEVVEKQKEFSRTHIPEIPPEVFQFCNQERIVKYVPVAVDIIERSFRNLAESEMRVEEDPETGEKWLMIAIAVQGTVEDVLQDYDRYTESWLAAVPWPECHKIRLSFDIL
ncbi:MAG: hypothetical protein FJ106_06970 [Deltaproteobacteria bacterium]|nr:hypothetical protein [Deltaproteobacteria bacterium]